MRQTTVVQKGKARTRGVAQLLFAAGRQGIATAAHDGKAVAKGSLEAPSRSNLTHKVVIEPGS